MTRILAVRFAPCPSPDRAGVEGEQILAALGPRHDLDALVVRSGDQPLFELSHGARVVRVPLGNLPPGERAAAFARAVDRQLSSESYDLLWLAVGRTALASAVIEALPPDLRLVVELEAIERGADWGAVAELAAGLDRAAALVVRSEAAAAALGPAVREQTRLVVAPPGVDVDRFDHEEKPAGPARLLVCGRAGLAGRAGLRRLAEAAARLEGKVRLSVPGPVEPATRAALEAVAPGCLEWPGVIPHEAMPALIGSSLGTVCATPVDEEAGPPLGLLEAMACGRVALAAAGPAAAHLLDDGRAGVLLSADLFGPDGDTATLAGVLRAYVFDDKGRAALGEAGRARVRERFTASARRRTLRSVIASIGAPVAAPVGNTSPGPAR